MKWVRFPIALSSLLLAATYSARVAACSMLQGYKVPTTLELVEAADAIVLARVDGEIRASGESRMGKIQLSPEKLLYGSELPKTGLTFRGYLQTRDMIPTNSDPYELAQANPDAFWGFCNRYVFRKDMLLLLFLQKQKDGSYVIIDASFARTLEDVPDENAPWVRAVQFYSTVAREPKAVRKQKLLAEQARLTATGNPTDSLIAKDIGRQIKGKRTQNYD